MYTPVLANKLTELADKFGLHTDVFIAHAIAFTVLVIVVVKFGIKPIMQQLEERRARIEEGEAMHARSEKELAEVKATGEKILAEAHASGKEQVEHARETAAKLQAELADKAAAEARTIIENAKQQADMDTQRQKEALKSEFARLVAQATAQVTGKVLSEADHRAINAEAINQL
ncbi:MAG: ATP synthase F0 subunit B [Akkermansia sp.]|nr:ATP synthase F0 subunit B [Akkermansiaceae bacterium]MBQ4594441.1 ATP synthase F0 subunit B [Akkermansia sp.]MBQ9095545.1 ATP synthase F0 subunit B [Akkermansia sp.]MBR1997219.1 ATP synthase F0 subunit B [Akkermansia sp.]MBR3695571.1 ATP synthase F0 subunit B [Akkermansia sp.]